jgi:hypothetical protein
MYHRHKFLDLIYLSDDEHMRSKHVYLHNMNLRLQDCPCIVNQRKRMLKYNIEQLFYLSRALYFGKYLVYYIIRRLLFANQ